MPAQALFGTRSPLASLPGGSSQLNTSGHYFAPRCAFRFVGLAFLVKGLDGESADRAIIVSPQCASSSDPVREIKYQILQFRDVVQFRHPFAWCQSCTMPSVSSSTNLKNI
jgi:hypothetical protein